MRDHEFDFVARTVQGAYVSGMGLGQYFSTYDIDGALRLSDAGFNSIAKQIAVDRVRFAQPPLFSPHPRPEGEWITDRPSVRKGRTYNAIDGQ